METSPYPLPPRIAPFSGQIVDVDGHEQIPINLWEDEFGSVTNALRDGILQDEKFTTRDASANGMDKSLTFDQVAIDDTPIDADTVFGKKLERAPGGISLDRRLEVLDFIGIDRQIIFPGLMPLNAVMLRAEAHNPSAFPNVRGDRAAYAKQLLGAYNDWVVRNGRKHSRYRFVGILLQDNLDDLMRDTRRMIDQGVRAFWTPQAFLIGGYSPAHTALDPFWALLADAGAPFTSHISGETEFLNTMEWRSAPAFEGWKVGGEFQLDPWTLCSLHMSAQNRLTCMVMGGVFERHPQLRFGIAEVGAYWFGQHAETMDLWFTNSRKFMQLGGNSSLRMKPSEYLHRNVRISPFDIENVGTYIARHGLEDCFCFTADLPHHEGGQQPIEDFANSLSDLSDRVLRKFFVENGRLLFPD